MVRPALKANIMFFSSIVFMLVPTILVVLIGWQSAASLAMLAAMGGLFSMIGLHGRGMLLLVIAMGVTTFAASLVSNNPWASAVLMLICGAGLGAVNKWGLSLWNFMFPVFAAAVIAQPPKVATGALPNALLTSGIAMGSLILAAVLTMILVKEPRQKEITVYPLKVNVMYAVNLGLLLAAAGYFSSIYRHEQLGVWLTLTIVIILIYPYAGQSTSRAIQRAAGTILGFLIAIGVGASGLPDFLFYAAAFVFLEIALLMRIVPGKKYWEYVMFLTPGVVLISGKPAELATVSHDRLYATIIAAVACLLVLAIERGLFWRGGLNKKPDLAS
jgi:hypothetical protein